MFIITDLQRGGAERMLLKLIQHIGPDVEPLVLSLIGLGDLGLKIQELGVPVKFIGMTPRRPRIADLLTIKREIQEFRPEVVHTWMYHADLYGGIAAKLAGDTKVIWGLRASDSSVWGASLFSRLILKGCALLSHFIPDAIQSCSERGKSFHQGLGYAKRKFIVIPNGVNLDEFAPKKADRESARKEIGVKPGEYVIGMVARLDPLKNHEGFLEAAANLCQIRSDVHFVLVGEGLDPSNEKFGELINKLKLQDRVHLLGVRTDISRLTLGFDLACLTSWSEGFPNVLIEAMGSGVPCVATNVGDIEMIVGDSGVVVPRGDMKAMAEAWNEYLSLDESDRIEAGRKARSRALELFEISNVTRRYEAMYKDPVKHISAYS